MFALVIMERVKAMVRFPIFDLSLTKDTDSFLLHLYMYYTCVLSWEYLDNMILGVLF